MSVGFEARTRVGPGRNVPGTVGSGVIDVTTTRGVQRLHEQLERCREKIRPFRRTRRLAIMEYVGSLYSQDTDEKRDMPVIVNLLQQAVETHVLLLTGGQPRVLVSTTDPQLKAVKNRLQVAINNVLKGIHFADTLRQIVLDAMFRVGIAKVYMAEGRQAEVENDAWIEIGVPFVKRISLDNFLYDTTRSRWSEIRFAADEYELPFQALREDDFYDPKVVDRIIPTIGHDWQTGDDQKVRDLSTGLRDDPVYKEDFVTLMDVWLPETNQIAVMARYDHELPPLAVVDWEGQQDGPYELLFMGDVPDNIMPISMVDQLKPMHDIFNRLMRKLIRQAERQKSTPWFTPSGEDDMRRLRETPDGGTVKIRNPESIGVFESGGADQGNLAFATEIQSLFDRQAGNLSAMAGLGPQSGTVGQDELIHGQVSKKLAKYGEKVTEFSNRVVRGVAPMVWGDDVSEVPGELEVPGAASIPYNWSADYRKGEFTDFHFEIDSYSLGYESPEMKLQKFKGNLELVMSMWPAFQESGAVLDPREILDEIADLSNDQRIKKAVSFGRDPALQVQGGAEQKQAPHTIRENVRRNVSAGPTDEARRNVLQDMLTNENPQSNQRQQGQAVSLGG